MVMVTRCMVLSPLGGATLSRLGCPGGFLWDTQVACRVEAPRGLFQSLEMVTAMREKERRGINFPGDFMTRPGAIPRKALLVAPQRVSGVSGSYCHAGASQSGRKRSDDGTRGPASRSATLAAAREAWPSLPELNTGPSQEQRLLDAFQTSVSCEEQKQSH
jgi:hypothetical protein